MKIQIKQEMYLGNDQVIWKMLIKTSKGYLQRPTKFLYSLVLSCNNESNIYKSKDYHPIEIRCKNNGIKVNTSAPEFKPNETAAAIDSIVVIGNVRILWKVDWIEYYLQLNSSFRRY